MMTKTVAKEYKKSKISIYSIDPGWVSDQFPSGRHQAQIPLPLDLTDAAARITQPLFDWKNTDCPPTGIFIKDYIQTDW
jgi:NAD(P)-dependent dehydrogenase (short-subunit alcohol dehydrogenase family)